MADWGDRMLKWSASSYPGAKAKRADMYLDTTHSDPTNNNLNRATVAAQRHHR